MRGMLGAPSFAAVLRLSPEPWVGAHLPWTEETPKYNEAFKNMVDCRAWDKMTKTWWFPRAYEPHVVQLVREHKLVSDAHLDACRPNLYQDKKPLTARQAHEAGLTGDFHKLGLAPNAPPELSKLAMGFWRMQAASIGAPTQDLIEKEEAYRRICAVESAQ